MPDLSDINPNLVKRIQDLFARQGRFTAEQEHGYFERFRYYIPDLSPEDFKSLLADLQKKTRLLTAEELEAEEANKLKQEAEEKAAQEANAAITTQAGPVEKESAKPSVAATGHALVDETLLPGPLTPAEDVLMEVEQARLNAESNTEPVNELAEMLKAAKTGIPGAQFKLGHNYEKGILVDQNIGEALRWYRYGTTLGDGKAANRLGDFYYYGDRVSLDPSEAVKWYQKAANLGNAEGQFNLAACYDSGTGVVKNHTEAIKWYSKAVAQGMHLAANRLGDLYFYGIGVPKDFKQAVIWYSNAAFKDNTEAQFQLALCYENGFGIEKNPVEALKWYKKAADAGDQSAKTGLERLGVSLGNKTAPLNAGPIQARTGADAIGQTLAGSTNFMLPTVFHVLLKGRLSRNMYAVQLAFLVGLYLFYPVSLPGLKAFYEHPLQTFGYWLFAIPYVLAYITAYISIGIRRCHDADMTGWWLLFPIVPLFAEAVKGSNKYGPEPGK
ncbi:MAG: DUF805 domain-containing protein [Bacteroidota bacterium]